MNMISSAMSEVGGTLSRASQGIKIAVDQDNILEAARIIASEAEYLKRKITARMDGLYVDPMGGDPVSEEAARALTELFVRGPDSYVNRCLEYAAMLETLAKHLFESAQTYEITEAESAALFDVATKEGHDRPLDLTGSRFGGLRAI